MTSLTVRAGTIKPGEFVKWLNSDSIKNLEASRTVYALLEYMHRFKFADWNSFLEDIATSEIEGYCLRGRIFWEDGQIEWRRMDEETYSILVLEDGGTMINLPNGFITTQESPPDIKNCEDTTILLWGTYNDQLNEFLEKRVSGSQPIAYPPAFKNGKNYPVIWVRIYKDDEGEPVFWRFVKPDTMNLEDWEEKEEVQNVESR